jgi:hypothetical protein
MIKRYAFFSGDIYYPRGGGSDLIGTTNNLKTVMNKISRYEKELEKDPDKYEYKWFQIFDLEEEKEIYSCWSLKVFKSFDESTKEYCPTNGWQ